MVLPQPDSPTNARVRPASIDEVDTVDSTNLADWDALQHDRLRTGNQVREPLRRARAACGFERLRSRALLPLGDDDDSASSARVR